MSADRLTSWMKRHPKALTVTLAVLAFLIQAQAAIASSQGASGP